MENLTAFVRERSRRNDAERSRQDSTQDFKHRVSQRAYFMWLSADRPEGDEQAFWYEAVRQEKLGEPPATDIAAVLTVIMRRSEWSRERESTNDWWLDLGGAVLRRADLASAHLEGAWLWGAHLEGANLGRAHLEEASLGDAHLEEARLEDAHLERAELLVTHFEGANLGGAHLEGAFLIGAHLEGASLRGAHLEGADLRHTVGLSEAQLAETHGDDATQLPEGMTRAPHWPAPDASTAPREPDEA
jgi:hypothetical protein